MSVLAVRGWRYRRYNASIMLTIVIAGIPVNVGNSLVNTLDGLSICPFVEYLASSYLLFFVYPYIFNVRCFFFSWYTEFIAGRLGRRKKSYIFLF